MTFRDKSYISLPVEEKGLILLQKSDSQFERELREFAEKTGGTCDKCGQVVPPWNNVSIFEYINTGGSVFNYLNLNRHFLPVVDEHNVVICEGSPSRSQYLSQGMMETRRAYPKNERSAAIVPLIFELMQRIFPHED